MKKKLAESNFDFEQLEAQIENFKKSVNFDDVIRMEFLEQSAKYLGVYVENTPTSLLDDQLVS